MKIHWSDCRPGRKSETSCPQVAISISDRLSSGCAAPHKSIGVLLVCWHLKLNSLAYVQVVGCSPSLHYADKIPSSKHVRHRDMRPSPRFAPVIGGPSTLHSRTSPTALLRYPYPADPVYASKHRRTPLRGLSNNSCDISFLSREAASFDKYRKLRWP